MSPMTRGGGGGVGGGVSAAADLHFETIKSVVDVRVLFLGLLLLENSVFVVIL